MPVITQKLLGSLKARETRYEIHDDRLTGFMVRVSRKGEITYYCQYARGRKKRIGRYPVKTLERGRAECIEMLAAWEQAKAKGAYSLVAEKKGKELQTMQAFLEKVYVPQVLTHKRSGRATEKRLRSAFEKLLDKDMSTFNELGIRRWITTRRRKVSPETIGRDLTALKSMLAHAVRFGVLEVNPLRGVRAPEGNKDDRVRYLSENERERLLAALEARTDYLKPLVLVALNTGCRRGELFSLRWEDVSLSQGRMTVRRATAKSNRTRHVPLNAVALGALSAWKGHGEGEGLVFPNAVTGERLTTSKTAWRRLVREAEIEDFRLHDCRHDFASSLVRRGVDLYVVKDLLGHATIQMTERYAHLAPDQRVEAVARLVEARP